MKMKGSFGYFIIILLFNHKVLSFTNRQCIEWDSYARYPYALKPSLAINSTTYEDKEYEEHLDLSSQEDLSLKSKQKIFNQIIISPVFKFNFKNFLIGIASAWLHELYYFEEIISSSDFAQGKCKLEDLWNLYQQILTPNQSELSDIIIQQIPGDIPIQDKITKCNNIIKEELFNLRKEIVRAQEIISDRQIDLDQSKGKPHDKAGLLNIIQIQQQVGKDSMKVRRQIKQINCSTSINNSNITFNYALLMMTEYLKPFLIQYERCLNQSIKGRGIKVLSHILKDIRKYTQKQSSDSIARIITFKVWGIVKSIFFLIRLLLSVYKQYKAFKTMRWDKFAQATGKSIGLSIRIIVSSL